MLDNETYDAQAEIQSGLAELAKRVSNLESQIQHTPQPAAQPASRPVQISLMSPVAVVNSVSNYASHDWTPFSLKGTPAATAPIIIVSGWYSDDNSNKEAVMSFRSNGEVEIFHFKTLNDPDTTGTFGVVLVPIRNGIFEYKLETTGGAYNGITDGLRVNVVGYIA